LSTLSQPLDDCAMPLTVRRIRADDAEVLRAHRLAALQGAPSAFGSTYEREAGFTTAVWSARATAAAKGSDRATFFAMVDDTVVGLAGGMRSEADPSVVELVSMWASPTARRAGVGRALVASIVEWSQQAGAVAVELWVTHGNEPATLLYESCGFAEMGDYQPLPSDPCRNEVRMRLVL
jgi:GNAT superfamily N-acetyltransferase